MSPYDLSSAITLSRALHCQSLKQGLWFLRHSSQIHYHAQGMTRYALQLLTIMCSDDVSIVPQDPCLRYCTRRFTVRDRIWGWHCHDYPYNISLANFRLHHKQTPCQHYHFPPVLSIIESPPRFWCRLRLKHSTSRPPIIRYIQTDTDKLCTDFQRSQ